MSDEAATHYHSCPGCNKDMPRACSCLEPGTPRFCYNRVPGERSKNCPNYYVSEQARAEDGNLTQVMKMGYLADLAAKATKPEAENPILEACRMGLLILDMTHTEKHRSEACVVCAAGDRLRTIRARFGISETRDSMPMPVKG